MWCPGHVQLAVPRDADDDVPGLPSQQKLAALRARRQSGKLAPKLPQSAVRRAAALIAQAKRPIFYGGGGLVNAGPEACEAFADLVRHTGAPHAGHAWHGRGQLGHAQRRPRRLHRRPF
ncbi:hypothetical protein G6F22_018262 [Rhizopus arrhizus]|nr:hypothetical protein G6F22_018262 [Rhizopus arrhizus]